MLKTCIGIDPGVNGGIASVLVDNYTIIANRSIAYETPKDDKGILCLIGKLVRESILNGSKILAGIEKVGGFIRGNPRPGSDMFVFGRSYGQLSMALTASGVEPVFIPPTVWQKRLGIDKRRDKETTYKWKGRLLYNAEQLFPRHAHPNLIINRSTCDALLIAAYMVNHQI